MFCWWGSFSMVHLFFSNTKDLLRVWLNTWSAVAIANGVGTPAICCSSCCDAMSTFSIVGWLTSTLPDSCSFVGVSLSSIAVKLKRESGISLAAAAREISVDCSFWHCLLHCLQSARSIFAACRSVRCVSSSWLRCF